MMSRQVDYSDLKAKLISWLQKKMPQARNFSISNIERSGAGFSNETFLFDLSWEEKGQSRSEGLLLRTSPQTYPVYPDYDLSKQFRILEALQPVNVPVPRVYWLEKDRSILGSPFFLMGRLDGKVPPDFPVYHTSGICHDASPEQRAKMWWSCIDAMVKIHKFDWKKAGLSVLDLPGDDSGPLGREWAYWERYLNWAKEEPEPILEEALDWLKKNQYAPERITLCWGDARLPNTIWSPDCKLLGVLDWEMAYLGDPESDFVFFLSFDRFLSDDVGIPRLPGLPGKEETIEYYEKLTGWKVKNLLYNEVSAAVRSGTVVLKVTKNLQKIGILPPSDGSQMNNFATQRLARLLNLAPPGAGSQKKDGVRIDAVTVTVQFHLTGPRGRDWYVLSDKGEVSLHEGRAANPDVTVTASAEDWAAIRSGELKRFHAHTSGRLKTEGKRAIFDQLEDTIIRLDSCR
jgi:aminoglycoside phosphotransferase (APT) family kinase protein/putative sterol carrier protein